MSNNTLLYQEICDCRREIAELRAALANAIEQADYWWSCADGVNELNRHIPPEHRALAKGGDE